MPWVVFGVSWVCDIADAQSTSITVDVGAEYTLWFNGTRWTDALDKNTTRNVTFTWDMLALVENEHKDDNGSIEVLISNCSFVDNGAQVHSVVGNVLVDDPFGIATVRAINNTFWGNQAKVGASLVHLSGYTHAAAPLDLSGNHQDEVANCYFGNNSASDTGNVVVHNADLFTSNSTCEANRAGLDGACIASYSSSLEVQNVEMSGYYGRLHRQRPVPDQLQA